MAGPMAYLAPGKRSLTAWAMTCAVEWRSTSRPSSESGVMIATLASCSIGRLRSYHSPAPSLRRRVPAPLTAQSRFTAEIHTEEDAQFAQHRGRGGVVAAGEHCA